MRPLVALTRGLTAMLQFIHLLGGAGWARTDDPRMVWVTQVPSGYKNVMFANAFSDRKKLSFSS